jgi:hypothetical protein
MVCHKEGWMGMGEGKSVTVPSGSFGQLIRLSQWSLNPWALLGLLIGVGLLDSHVASW